MIRALLHAIAVFAAAVAFILLEPAIRNGRMSIVAGMLAVAVVFVASLAAIVVILGLASARPVSQWPAIARQLFQWHRRR